jgi:hypothetical protein
MSPKAFGVKGKNMKHECHIRDAVPEDLNFIFSTFSASMNKNSSLGSSCTKTIFFHYFRKIIDELLSNYITKVAVHTETGLIIGYIIYEQPDIVYYTYVKAPYRRMGIAKWMISELLPQEQITFLFQTQKSKQIQKTHPNLTCNPFLLYMKGITIS